MLNSPEVADFEQYAAERRRQLAAQAQLNAAVPADPARARADTSLRAATGFPLPIFDAVTRQMAEVRARQNEVQNVVARAPRLAAHLSDQRTWALVADDLEPLANTSAALVRFASETALDTLTSMMRAEMSESFEGRASRATDRLLRGRPNIDPRARRLIERSYRNFYNPNNPLRTTGNIVVGATASANEMATGALEGAYDVLTLRTFGVRTPADDLRDEVRRRGTAGLTEEGRAMLALAGIDPNNPDREPDHVRRYLQGVRASMQTIQSEHRINTGNDYVDAALRGIQSVPMQLGALYMAARGDPRMALTMMASMSGGQAYGEARDAGLTAMQSLTYAVAQGGLEALGEALPIFSFAEDAARGSGLLRTLVRQFVAENAGEQFTQHSQDFVQWAAIESNRGKSLADYWAERPRVMRDTMIATTAAVGLQTPVARIIVRAVQQATEADEARQQANIVERVMEAARDSRLRREAPQEFQRLVEDHLDEVENIYIPAERIRELFQSPDDLANDGFWGDYSEQIAAAELLGGDVVVPLAAVATNLAGNAQWEALKDHIRTSPGGMSRTEAQDAESAFFDAMQESGEALAAEMAAERERMAPAEKVYEAMRDKLMLAGFRTDVASTIAEQFANRQRVRALRLGRPLTGTEADAVEVRQVLPEKLAKAISAAEVPDAGLRAVIALMRRGSAPRSARTRFGPSLIEFIQKRGGIEDRGGDLASMGAGKIGKGFAKKGTKKLIRPHDDADLLGGRSNDNSPDAIALAAWEAGYFPNMPDRPAVDDLLQAIGRELAGDPVYADDRTNEADVLREAAQELREMLDQQGIDPDKASDTEIARTVSQYQAERSSGRGYDQALFDDPAQPQRSMTQVQRAELEARQLQGKARRGGQQSVKDQEGGLFSSERDQGSLFQSFGDGPRGRITFTSDGRATIDLFEARDLSTFIHESGHLYLEELKADAEIGRQIDTPEGQQLAADYETVKAWFASNGHAVAKDGTIPTEAHELFARGFERYAMEGKAPSSALRRAFEAFRSWLISIYRNVARLNAPITPEIRDVMARLLATDEEIIAAAEEQNIKLGFTSAAEAGMTEAEYEAYRQAATEATEGAHTALLKKTMNVVRAARTKEFRTQEAEVRAEVMAAVDAQPVFRALAMLRSRDTPVKLDRQFLIDSYGGTDILPQGVPPIWSDTNTVHPDIIAQETGFSSGDEMIRTLIGHEQARKEARAQGDKRSPRQIAIDEGTAETMAERYGDPLADGSIEQEARALIHNDAQGEVFATELRALARQTGRRPTAYSIARKWADERVAASRVVDAASGAAIQQYTRSARKAGKAFEEALIRGDRNEAFKQKQAQMLNNALVAAAKEAKDRVDVAVRRLGKLAKARTRASMDQDYLDQIHGLLEQVEFRPRSQVSLERQQSYEAWAEQQRQAGFDLVGEPEFARSLGTTHWSRLSVEQLLGLDATAQQIAHLGRLKQSLLDGQERRKFEEARDELIASADGSGKGRKITANNDPARSLPERFKSRIRGIDALLIKMETLVDWLDGGNSNGPWNRLLFKPLADAQGAEGDLMRGYIEKINALVKEMPRKQARDWDRFVETPELVDRVSSDPALHGRAFRFGKDQIVMMALNMGNDGNKQRLLDGYGWSEAQMRAVLDRHMTAEDWQFVQAIWDALETLKAPLFAMERRVNGVEPETVQAVPVETPFGTFRGGYFPAVYDPNYQTQKDIKDAEQMIGGGGFYRATTRSSATKERAAQVRRPLLLSMTVITNHMREVIHDITHREAVQQAAKILADGQVRAAVDRKLGPEYLRAMDNWLTDVAKPGSFESVLGPFATRIGRWLHRGVTVAGLGYRVSTVLVQPLGLSNAAGVVGERAVAEGMAIFAAHPLRTYREVTERSAEMRDRFSTMDASIADMYRDQGKAGLRRIGPGRFVRHAFDGILYADLLITTGTWIGAFNKGLREGMTEAEATYYADKVIRTSQGAGGAKDRSWALRMPHIVRSFYPFFSYLNALYNQQRDIGRRARNIGTPRDVATVVGKAWWIVVVPALAQALLFGDGPDEDDEESWAAYLTRSATVGNFSSIPGVGPVATAVGNGWNYRASSIQQVGEGFVQALRDTEASLDSDPDSEPRGNWIKNLFATIGVATGTPLAAPGASAQFMADYLAGEVEPESFDDWREGLTTGRLRDED